tara:strand:- start:1833 stop:3032 length:1200 start_codon:yes stop_codon:yes gene_type:complete
MAKIKKCKICLSNKIRSVLNLGAQPAANSLHKNKTKQKKYPLNLCFCRECSTAQLSVALNPKNLFSKYSWVSSTSETAKNYSLYFYKRISKFIKKKSNILEIASNDGLFLKVFKNGKHNVLGVDPAKNIAKFANKKGIKTIPEFFSYNFSKKIKKSNKKFDFIFARNVIPHVKEVHSVVKGMANLAENKSIIAVEFHYAKEIIKDLQYDSIYHEHIYYFTIKSISNLFKKYKLFPFDVFKSPISGGSLVLLFSKENRDKSEYLKKLENIENKLKINSFYTWKKFGFASKRHAINFVKKINKFNTKSKFIGYGASARSSTFLNYCNLNSSNIEFIIDQNPLKRNLYTPGTNIQIFPFNKIKSKIKSQIIILLAWNFKKEIINFLKKNSIKNKITIPFKNQ